MIISIDPSSISTGVAVFETGKLFKAYRVLSEDSDPISMAEAVLDTFGFCIYDFKSICEAVVVEYPQPFAHQKPRIADLIKLSATAGAIAAMLVERFGGGVRWVKPSEWKFQIPKPKTVAGRYIVEHRARALLSPDELAQVELPGNVRQQWDVWDAIGLGLFAIGRCRRGVRR